MAHTAVKLSPRNFAAAFKLALLPTPMPHAIVGARLGALLAALENASLPPPVAGAKTEPANGALRATFNIASSSSSVCSAKKLVPGSALAAWKSAPSASPVRDAEPRPSLGALGAAFLLTGSCPAMILAVWCSTCSNLFAAFHPARFPRLWLALGSCKRGKRSAKGVKMMVRIAGKRVSLALSSPKLSHECFFALAGAEEAKATFLVFFLVSALAFDFSF
mmetsp:Transcript_7577/g.15234  ORF Transcript_7577/g.15234 Transcript_7577/m.15234 type:complete len:220 (+) Transcript_7577:123-782(+)